MTNKTNTRHDAICNFWENQTALVDIRISDSGVFFSTLNVPPMGYQIRQFMETFDEYSDASFNISYEGSEDSLESAVCVCEFLV